MIESQKKAHFNMLEQQIRPSEVRNPRVLNALETLSRSDFVDESLAGLAYADTELPIGFGQYILSPVFVARMLQAIDVQADEKVLEIGTGTGYITALLAQLAEHVTTVEMVSELSEIAQKNMRNTENVTFSVGDAARGWQLADRIDVIVLTASFTVIPDDYLQSLKVGGRLIAVIGEQEPMSVTVIRRVSEREWQYDELFETVIPSVMNEEPQPQFEF